MINSPLFGGRLNHLLLLDVANKSRATKTGLCLHTWGGCLAGVSASCVWWGPRMGASRGSRGSRATIRAHFRATIRQMRENRCFLGHHTGQFLSAPNVIKHPFFKFLVLFGVSFHIYNQFKGVKNEFAKKFLCGKFFFHTNVYTRRIFFLQKK